MNKHLTHFLLLLSGLFLISACRTESQEQKETSTNDEPVTISSRIRSNPDKLNPSITFMGPAIQICRMVFPTLIEYDPVTLELGPMLAKTRPTFSTFSEGPYAGKSAYTYEIHDEAVWDNGSPVTASDYIFSLKVLFNPLVPSSPYRGLLNFIEDVITYPDQPKKLTVVIREPYIKSEYNTGGIFVIPEYHYDPQGLLKDFKLSTLFNQEEASKLAESDEKLKAFADEFTSTKFSHEVENVVGCGPYRVTEWKDNERVVLTKKENWWGESMGEKYTLLQAKPDQIIYVPVRDGATAVNMVKDGSIDAVKQLSNNQFLELQNSDVVKENYNLFNPDATTYNYLGLNTKSPKLEDKRVRKALAYLMDVEEVIRTAKKGMAKPIVGPVPRTSKFYHP
ncbi:MAG: ABC transporter substrate-binding protein, partial [Bacteroidota bacterium]